MKKILLLGIFLFQLVLLRGQNTQSQRLFFESNSSELVLESEAELEVLINALQVAERFDLIIETYPTSAKFSKNDLKVQEERVNNLTDYLLLNDIIVKRIAYFSEQNHADFDLASVSDWNFLNLEYTIFDTDLSEESVVKKPKNFFEEQIKWEKTVINNQSRNVIKLEEGTVLKIPSKAFVNQDGEPVVGEIQLRTMEVLSVESAIAANFYTETTDGAALESLGMIQVDAFDKNNQPLNLAEGKYIDAEIPMDRNTSTEGFNIYKGVTERDYVMNWDLADSKLEVKQKSPRKKYVWKKMSRADREELKEQRTAYIQEWELKGRKHINKTLRRYKRNLRVRKRNIKFRNGNVRYTRSERDFEQLRKSDIIANAKHRWHLDADYIDGVQYGKNNTTNILISTGRFRMRSLGAFNIDKLLSFESNNRLIVENSKDRKVTAMFKDSFVLLEGKHKKGKVVFKRLPSDQKLIIVGMRELEDGMMEVSTIKASTNVRNHKFGLTKTLSKAEALKYISSLKNDSEDTRISSR